MSLVHCYTSASLAYLDRARILGETIRRHHPDWVFSLCLCDVEPPGFTFRLECEPFDYVVRLDKLGIPALEQWIFCHDVVELCTAAKGPMLRYLFQTGAENVIYLDPDMALLQDIGHVPELLEEYSVILTPHQLEPDQEKGAILDNEIGSLKHGIYNLGFLAVRNTTEGRRFADWWRDRLLEFCYDDIPRGLFTDQRWCDLVPAFFDGVYILKDPGYNVASWNLSRRPIRIDQEGMIWAADRPLRFFHFTKISWVGQIMLERYSAGRVEVFELVKWYMERLAANKADGLPEGWWAFSRYRDGTPILKAHRVAYRSREDLRVRFPDPFTGGSEGFAAHLAEKKVLRQGTASASTP